MPIAAGVDEIALALTADAFSRTYRSHAYAVADSAGVIRSQHGLMVLPDRFAGEDKLPRHVRAVSTSDSSIQVLDGALADIASTYGSSTAGFVALQLEYPWVR